MNYSANHTSLPPFSTHSVGNCSNIAPTTAWSRNGISAELNNILPTTDLSSAMQKAITLAQHVGGFQPQDLNEVPSGDYIISRGAASQAGAVGAPTRRFFIPFFFYLSPFFFLVKPTMGIAS